MGVLLVGLAGCGGRQGRPAPSPADPASAPAASTSLVPSAPIAAPAALPPPSIVKRRAPLYDGSLPAPGMSLGFEGLGRDVGIASVSAVGHGVSYDVIVDMKTLCVVETRSHEDIGELFMSGRTRRITDERLIEVLGSERVATALGDRLALREELAWVKNAAVPSAAPRTDGNAASSADRRVVALLVDDRLFVSDDGGHRFRRVPLGDVSNPSDIRLSDDGSRAAFVAASSADRAGDVSLVVVDLRGDREVARVSLGLGNGAAGWFPLRAVSPEGRLLFGRTERRCFGEVDPWASEVRIVETRCLEGTPPDRSHFFFPRVSPNGRFAVTIDGDFQVTRGALYALDGPATGKIAGRTFSKEYDLHNIVFGPTDDGRFVWDRASGVRMRTPEGLVDLPSRGMLAAIDLGGAVLTFRQPPLERPHVPGKIMPRTKDTLDGVKCKLFERTEPSRGRRVSSKV